MNSLKKIKEWLNTFTSLNEQEQYGVSSMKFTERIRIGQQTSSEILCLAR